MTIDFNPNILLLIITGLYCKIFVNFYFNLDGAENAYENSVMEHIVQLIC